MPRQYFPAASLARTTNTTTTPSPKVALTFTPDASRSYVVFFHCLLDSTANAVANDLLISDGTTTYITRRWFTGASENNNSKRPFSGFFIFTASGSPSAITFTMNFLLHSAGTQTLGCQQARLIAVRLETTDTLASTAAATTTTSTTYAARGTMTLPAGAGTYLLLASAGLCQTVGSGNNAAIRATIGGSVFDEANPMRIGSVSATASYVGWMAARRFDATGGEVFNVDFAAIGANTVGIIDVYLLALRLDGFSSALSAQDLAAASTTGTTFLDMSTLPVVPQSVDYLEIICHAVRMTNTNTTTAFLASTQLVLDNVVQDVVEVEGYFSATVPTVNYVHSLIRIENLSNAAHVLKVQYNSNNAALTTRLADSGIHLLQLVDTRTPTSPPADARGACAFLPVLFGV